MEAISIYPQSLTNPNPKCTKKSRTWIKQVCKPEQVNKVKSRLICGKRNGNDHLELPSKRRLVSKDDGVSSNSMVEAKHQPCQSQ